MPAEKIYVPHYIDDPYGGDLNTYRKCRDKICEELQTFEQHLGFLRSVYADCFDDGGARFAPCGA